MKLRPDVLNREISAAALFQSWLGILEADIILGKRLRNCHQASLPHSPASLFLSPPLTQLSSTQRRCSLSGVTPRLMRRPTNLLLFALQCGQPLLNPPGPAKTRLQFPTELSRCFTANEGHPKGKALLSGPGPDPSLWAPSQLLRLDPDPSVGQDISLLGSNQHIHKKKISECV